MNALGCFLLVAFGIPVLSVLIGKCIAAGGAAHVPTDSAHAASGETPSPAPAQGTATKSP